MWEGIARERTSQKAYQDTTETITFGSKSLCFMNFYNIAIDIRHRKCVVVGGGKIAFRKAKKLCEAGATVLVVSPTFIPDFTTELSNYTIQLVEDVYRKEYLKDAFLAFATTSEPEINENICEDAKELGIWINSANGIDYGNFIIPATCKQGILKVSITTEGLSPALSKHLRRHFQEKIKKIEEQLLDDIVLLRKEMVAEKNDTRKGELQTIIEDKAKEIVRIIDDKNKINE